MQNPSIIIRSMRRTTTLILFILLSNSATTQDAESFELNTKWLVQIEKNLPAPAGKKETFQKNVLIFSLHTGFEHWIIPHTEAVMKLIANNSNNYLTTISYDITAFEKDNLKKFDLLILNNNCSVGDYRNLFRDVLLKDKNLNDQQRKDKANILENNLLSYVNEGGGLMVLHGAIVMQNKSAAFGAMIGGSFDYHPKQQNIQVKLVDPGHPLVTGFSAGGFEHIDEPYFFNNAYFDYNFRPLLYMESDQLDGLKAAVEDKIKYIAWIKGYGKGRVFYASPSHNAQSFENPELLEFFARGMRYAAGELACDDSPLAE